MRGKRIIGRECEVIGAGTDAWRVFLRDCFYNRSEIRVIRVRGVNC